MIILILIDNIICKLSVIFILEYYENVIYQNIKTLLKWKTCELNIIDLI